MKLHHSTKEETVDFSQIFHNILTVDGLLADVSEAVRLIIFRLFTVYYPLSPCFPFVFRCVYSFFIIVPCLPSMTVASVMTTRPTPASTAFRAFSIFGSMPPLMMPLAL